MKLPDGTHRQPDLRLLMMWQLRITILGYDVNFANSEKMKSNIPKWDGYVLELISFEIPQGREEARYFPKLQT